MFRSALVVASLALAGVAFAETPPTKSDATEKAPAKSATKTDAKKSDAKTTSKKSTKKSTKKSDGTKTAKSDQTASKSDGTKTSKKSGKKSDGKKAKSAPTGKRTKGKAAARVPWLPTRSTLANTQNLPSGFTWPPTQPMLEAEKDCESKLDRASVTWERAEREGRMVDAIVVPSMVFGGIKYTNQWGSKGPHRLDCQLALALETIGPELFALGVREVKFGSLYRWSNVRSGGVTRPYLSRHGLGLAMDIGSFVDESGKEAVVENDYKTGNELLHGIEQLINANGNFRIVLTPKNDPISHHNHFHIEAKSNYTSPDMR